MEQVLDRTPVLRLTRRIGGLHHGSPFWAPLAGVTPRAGSSVVRMTKRLGPFAFHSAMTHEDRPRRYIQVEMPGIHIDFESRRGVQVYVGEVPVGIRWASGSHL